MSVPAYSAQRMYHPGNYYALSQRFIQPAIYRPQYFIPRTVPQNSTFRLPLPVKRQSLVTPFQLKKDYFPSKSTSTVLNSNQPPKRVSRFNAELWRPDVSGSPESASNITTNTNLVQPTFAVLQNGQSKKKKNRFKKNQASLANELEKMRCTQDITTEHDMRWLSMSFQVRWSRKGVLR
ncbi:uncharacterized protein LOC115229176 [Octopus sinensis]|uniref:Uncharacterized protein LOC115229176 n=1 Tax=Octopus sinensis TaxID=2607531 RepID=A0A6P7U3G2_9MOLL|nr:uncharacterized protein LOC115229176 [Octopus sinensis]